MQKMSVAGIVAEFNPYHNGHRALTEAARAAGARYVVAVMSGNFVQRGEPAVTDKRVRAACALSAGVDLVFELPLAFATATARTFAKGAVTLLSACGCVDILCFGSECGDAAALETLSRAVESPETVTLMREYLSAGNTFARARQMAVSRSVGSRQAGPLSNPNDLLGIEYLRACATLDFSPRVLAVPRFGAAHDDPRASGSFASASWLRARAGRFGAVSKYMPASCVGILRRAADDGLYPADPAVLETAMLAHLRRLEREDLAALPDLSEGIENRLYSAIRSAGSLEELRASLKTKRYTLSRIRRLILSAFLGVSAPDSAESPPYLRILGFNGAGREILASIKEHAELPMGTSLRKLARENAVCARASALEARATDLYALSLPLALPCGYEYSAGAVFA